MILTAADADESQGENQLEMITLQNAEQDGACSVRSRRRARRVIATAC